jgi:hypothetical protein
MMEVRCISCGMPLTKPEDHAMSDRSKRCCRHCARPDGAMKSREEVLQGMTAFIIRTQGLDEAMARRAAQEMMSHMPAWASGARA